MTDTLLATKFHLPPLRKNFVPRPRLTTTLDGILAHKLTLISAPAGFGKTTLIREWVEAQSRSVGWLSLDGQDNSPTRFLLYLIQAFRQINPTVGETSQTLLQAAHRPHLSTVLTHLANDLVAITTPHILVLDDYHFISDPTIHEAMGFLIEHLPAYSHLVITSRSQPSLKLSRLRGQAQLLELTSANLRFTAAEVETFLKQTMRLDLSPAERSALEMRTEGWVAGLQLAGLSLQTQDDISTFISAFTGSDRYVGDYLFEEVLQHQPDEVRQFLLATSVADYLCADLCDALLERCNSQARLEWLEQHQLFIVPLDSQRQWYRYHQLFADLLRHQLGQIAPEQIPWLHRRASRWFEQHNRLEEAIRHSLAAQDFERAAALIETAFQTGDWVQRDMQHLLDWFNALPEEITQTRPNLALAYAWLLLEIYADPWDHIDHQLRQVEATLTTPDATVSLSPEEIVKMLAQVDLLRANQARHRKNPERVITLCRQALNRLPEEETYLRSGIIAHLASAYESQGNMTSAGQIYTDSIDLCRTANNLDGWLFAAARLIKVHHIGGQLRRSEQVFEAVLERASQRTGPDVGLLHIAIGEVYREQNRIESAKQALKRGLELCRPFAAWRGGVVSGVISLSRVLAAEGHFDRALSTLSSDETLQPLSPLEQIRLESVRTRLWLAQGEFDTTARWIKRSGLATMDGPDYRHEFEHLTLIRALLAQAELEARGIRPLRLTAKPLEDADQMLAQLHRAALSAGRLARVIEIRILQAIGQAIQQDMDAALRYLTEALVQAESEGFVRLFADEGRFLAPLLRLVRTNPPATISPEYLETLLAALLRVPVQTTQASLPPGNTLTRREHTTLSLLASELSIEEIAAEMTVSVSTVRTYTKRIYSKLDVHSRAEAVYRAKALKLL